MNSETWQKVVNLFDLCVSDAQGTHLNGETHEIRQMVRELVDAHKKSDQFLERPAVCDPSHNESVLDAGDQVGDFELRKKIGEGSFGSVFLALQVSLGREVALKITPDLGEEARTMAPIEHENIVKLFSEHTLDSRRLICMQYVPGASLEDLLREITEKPLTGNTVRSLLERLPHADRLTGTEWKTREINESRDLNGYFLWLSWRLCDALARTHAMGVCHLDVKPANVLLNAAGIPYLTDFNVALTTEANKTRARLVGGTVGYMSPEQRAYLWGGGPAPNTAADLYSLGVVMKELRLRLHSATPRDRLTTAYDAVVVDLLDLLTQEEPLHRPQSALECSLLLESCVARADIARRLPRGSPLLDRLAHHPAFSIVAMVFSIHLIATIVNVFHNQIRILDGFSTRQHAVFMKLVMLYNPIAFSFCTAACLLKLRQVIPTMNGRIAKSPLADQTKFRKMLIRLPQSFTLITACGWIPGTVFFSFMLDRIAGPITRSDFLHFFLANASSFAIAATFTVLVLETFIVAHLYPFTLVSVMDVRRAAFDELRAPLASSVRYFDAAVIFPFLIILGVMLGGTPDSSHPKAIRVFQLLIVSLSFIGIAGFFMARRGRQAVESVFLGLTGRGLERGRLTSPPL